MAIDPFAQATERAKRERRRGRTSPAEWLSQERGPDFQEWCAAYSDGGERYDTSRDPPPVVPAHAVFSTAADAAEGETDMTTAAKKTIKGVPVQYKKIGQMDRSSFAIPIEINASELSWTEVKQCLMSAEVDVMLQCDPEGKNDDPKQGKLVDTEIKLSLKGKIGRVSASHENYRFGLRCELDSVDMNDIAKFGNRTGKATFKKTGSAVDVAREDDDDGEDDGEGNLIAADRERS